MGVTGSLRLGSGVSAFVLHSAGSIGVLWLAVAGLATFPAVGGGSGITWLRNADLHAGLELVHALGDDRLPGLDAFLDDKLFAFGGADGDRAHFNGLILLHHIDEIRLRAVLKGGEGHEH